MNDFDNCEVSNDRITIDLQTLKDAYGHYQDICNNVRSEHKQMYYSGIADTILVLIRNIYTKQSKV
jgi:hypothetical protein